MQKITGIHIFSRTDSFLSKSNDYKKLLNVDLRD